MKTLRLFTHATKFISTKEGRKEGREGGRKEGRKEGRLFQ
jgi:predicted transposase YdaD